MLTEIRNRKVNSGRKEVEMFEVVKKAFRRYQRRKAERMKIRKTVKLAKINRTICERVRPGAP